MKKFRIISSILMSFLFITCCSVTYGEDTKWNEGDPVFNRDEVINDMFLKNNVPPGGIPAYLSGKVDWAAGPAITLKSLPIDKTTGKPWSAITAWGCVFAEQSSPNNDINYPDVRVHIKDLELYIYKKDGTWTLITHDVMTQYGASWGQFYQSWPITGATKSGNIRSEPSGGQSFITGSGYHYHFWSWGANLLDPKYGIGDLTNIKNVLVLFKARLIGNEDHFQDVKYVAHAGCDYWRYYGAPYSSEMEDGHRINNDDCGIGRTKLITPEWQYYTMHNFTKEEAEKIIFPLK